MNEETPISNNDISEVDNLKKERQEYLEGWQRARAELINYKKGEAERAETIMRFGNERLLRDVVTVMDSFDLSIASLEASGKDPVMLRGVLMTRTQLEHILKEHGLESIKSIGKEFNPVEHEVLMEIESDKSPGTVIEEVERGWKLYDKVIRPARVKVAKGK